MMITQRFEAQTVEIRLNRPEVLNALSLELLQELKHALGEAAQRGDVRAVLLTGEGRGFCAGADLAKLPMGQNVESTVETCFNPIIRLLATMPKPVIAAINGVAAGAGMSLALACDVRFMSEHATLTVGFTKIGLSLDAGMSYFLPKLVGRGRAFELSYSNRNVGANEALNLGLVETILPAEGFHDAALQIVKGLAQGPYSFALAKQLLNTDDLDKQLRLEATVQAQAAQSSDAREGIMAFVQKRKATFEGA